MQIRATPRKYVIRIVIAVFLITLLFYGLFQARFLLIGPIIRIETPQNGSRIVENLVEVRGVAENIVQISLDNRPIFIDEEGHFEEKLLLAEGYTIMTLQAEDRFGRTTKETLHLIR